MKRLRICQLITELRPAGAERCVYELATRLDRSRFDVQVAALRGGEVADRLAAAGIRVTVLQMRGKWDLGKLTRLPRLLRRERIDLLHTHLFHADLPGRPAARLAGVPRLVHTVHVAEARWRPWQFAYARFAAPWCDRIVCVSHAVRRFHARRSGLPGWKYTVIPNGIDADAYARSEEVRARRRAEWGIPDDHVLLAFVGRLDRQKGVDVLLEAMDRLAERNCAVRLVLAGDGPQRAMVAERLSHSRAGRLTRMLGFVHDVAGVLSAADVLVAPSRWEGFGLAAAEAMAAGLPVIATRVAGLSEIVSDGQTGLLIPPDDPAALAERIEKLACDPGLRERLGRSGRQRVLREYTIDANVAAHERLYRWVWSDPEGTSRKG